MTLYKRVPEGHPLVGSPLLLLFLEAVDAGEASGCHTQQAGIDSLQQSSPLPLLATTSQPQQYCSSRLQVFLHITVTVLGCVQRNTVNRIKTKSVTLFLYE